MVPSGKRERRRIGGCHWTVTISMHANRHAAVKEAQIHCSEFDVLGQENGRGLRTVSGCLPKSDETSRRSEEILSPTDYPLIHSLKSLVEVARSRLCRAKRPRPAFSRCMERDGSAYADFNRMPQLGGRLVCRLLYSGSKRLLARRPKRIPRVRSIDRTRLNETAGMKNP